MEKFVYSSSIKDYFHSPRNLHNDVIFILVLKGDKSLVGEIRKLLF